jgi:hypothetical protein
MMLILAALLSGCGALPGPYLTCEDVPEAACRAAHDEAVTNGLFLDDGEQIVAAHVRPTESRICPGLDEALYDVSFDLRGRSQPLVVTIGTRDAGGLGVCTY